MAQVIEFYIPARFKPKVKWIPAEQRGKNHRVSDRPEKVGLRAAMRPAAAIASRAFFFGSRRSLLVSPPIQAKISSATVFLGRGDD